ncbi:MAG: T9SS type A sorting domain-containing protein, partial [Flavobacteriales bacterium]|nr:T9SS type A sorting domain-containing protein [Flavobacteriales bacterium]
STALEGVSRMRIVKDYSGTVAYPADPCGSYDYGQAEDYLVNVTVEGGTGLVNDLCSGVPPEALAVGASLTFTGTTVGATEAGDFVPGSELEGAGPTVWHAFTTTECANVTISYCGTDPVFGSVWIFLSTECPAGTYTLATSYAFDCADGNVILNYDNLPAGTYYLPVQLEPESANGPYTIDVSAAACTPPEPYCTDLFSISQNMEPICSVLFAGIDNPSCATVNCGDILEDFTALPPAEVVAGNTYSLSVTGMSDGNFNNYVTAFFDWDQDSIFEASYQVGVITNSACETTVSGDIAVPSTALEGVSRMRIVKDYSGTVAYPADPCGSYDYGQAEDYLVNVQLPTGLNAVASANWSIYPNPGNGDIIISSGPVQGQVQVAVLDMTGRLVHAGTMNMMAKGHNTLRLAGQLAAGTYLLRLTGEAGRSEQRFMVR